MGGGGGGGGGKGKKGPDMGEIRAYTSELADMNFDALSFGGIFAILFTVVQFIWGALKAIKQLYDWIQPAIKTIVDFIRLKIIPIINTINAWLTSLKTIILILQGKIEDVINQIYQKIFPELEALRKELVDVFTKAQDIVSVFNKELSDKIGSVEQSLLRTIDKYTRDVRDQLIDYVHQVSDPVLHKIDEILIIIDTAKQTLIERISPLEKLLAITFEKPQVLKSETVRSTSLRWGMRLWEDLFSGVVPTGPIGPSPERISLEVEPIVDEHIKTIFAGQEGSWRDIDARVDEEIREAYYGELVPNKTPITYPKGLAAPYQGGGAGPTGGGGF